MGVVLPDCKEQESLIGNYFLGSSRPGCLTGQNEVLSGCILTLSRLSSLEIVRFVSNDALYGIRQEGVE